MKNKDLISGYLCEIFEYPECELNFSSDLELLIAVMLSAQCTDKRVNMVTEKLFKKYKSANEYKQCKLTELEQDIKTCGLYKSKAKHIKSACADIVDRFNGNIPKTDKDLCSLAGVGRKTANVVRSILYGDNVIAVDTHVLRVSNRLGLCNTNNPNICEQKLTKIFKHNLRDLHYRMVLFGRYKCKAINPKCSECKLNEICIHFKNNLKQPYKKV